MAPIQEKKHLYSPAGLGFFVLCAFVLFFPYSEFPLLFLLVLKCKIFHFWSLNGKTISLVLFQQIEGRVKKIIFCFDYDIGFGWKKG